MIEIKDLLFKFDSILLSEGKKKELVRNAISKIIKIELKSEDIKIKNNIIYLDIKPIYKNEILLKQDQIFSELEKLFGKRAPTALL